MYIRANNAENHALLNRYWEIPTEKELMSVRIREGAQIVPILRVSRDIEIGRVMMRGAIFVDDGSIIKDYSDIDSHVSIGANSDIECGVTIFDGSVIGPKISIGKIAVIGSKVTIPPGSQIEHDAIIPITNTVLTISPVGPNGTVVTFLVVIQVQESALADSNFYRGKLFMQCYSMREVQKLAPPDITIRSLRHSCVRPTLCKGTTRNNVFTRMIFVELPRNVWPK